MWTKQVHSAEGDRKEVDQEREENEEPDHSEQKRACN